MHITALYHTLDIEFILFTFYILHYFFYLFSEIANFLILFILISLSPFKCIGLQLSWSPSNRYRCKGLSVSGSCNCMTSVRPSCSCCDDGSLNVFVNSGNKKAVDWTRQSIDFHFIAHGTYCASICPLAQCPADDVNYRWTDVLTLRPQCLHETTLLFLETIGTKSKESTDYVDSIYSTLN